MRVAITGATGLIGSALSESLRKDGAEVLAITRGKSRLPDGSRPVSWDPARGEIDVQSLEGVDAVVHLAGESIAGRWTASKKKRIQASRVEGTRLLVDGLRRLARPPAALVCASGINYYGDRGEEELDESSAPGRGFLSDVCVHWEKEAHRAAEAGIRTAVLRTGVVLSGHGGALAQMLTPFKLGLGGPVGSGRQWMSWIHIEDVSEAYRFLLTREEATGAFNGTTPHPVRNREFGKALGGALRRPAVLPAPEFAIRLAFGQMGEELLLASMKVLPRRLEQAGFRFRHPELAEALGHLVGSGK